MLSEAEFVLTAREVKARTGALLTREMAAAAETRLAPLARREGFSSVSEMISAARTRPDGRTWAQIADALLQSETRFFRDRALHQRFITDLLPQAIARRGHERVRVWSAACASGQEPYSIAIALEDMRAEGKTPACEIIATDISERLLEKARAGLYTQFEVQRGLPIRKLIAYFEKAGDLWRISDRIRASVKFDSHNLMKHPGALGQFDFIFLCHTLPGFDVDARLAVFNRALDALSPEGVLLLGEGETLPDGAEGVTLEHGVVRRAKAARAAA
ncbi:MAG: protein-glutamate O-methyltransferase CheR [Hyphomonadaceae bacterium]|nr:protein-glutamate O-methyltransferase CheR [Hyphomonadaceae bacterium]